MIAFVAYCVILLMMTVKLAAENNTVHDQGDGLYVTAAWMNILHSTLGPCLVSAVNPIIFIVMTPRCREGICSNRLTGLEGRVRPL